MSTHSHLLKALTNNTLWPQNKWFHCRVLKKEKKRCLSSFAGVAAGYRAAGPSEVQRGNLTGHAHAWTSTQVCGTIGSAGGRWPFALCMYERGSCRILSKTKWAVKIATKEDNLSGLWFSVDCEKWAWAAGKLSCVILALIAPIKIERRRSFLLRTPRAHVPFKS